MRCSATWSAGLLAAASTITGAAGASFFHKERSKEEIQSPYIYYNDWGYEKGAYGAHPYQSYRTIPYDPPSLNVLQSHPLCESSMHTFLAPRGEFMRSPLAMMLDSSNRLVWAMGYKSQQIYNVRVQKYRGNDYITFWTGNDTVGGHGAGVVHMVSSQPPQEQARRTSRPYTLTRASSHTD